VNPEYVALALLVFALVATRLWEEERWRAGRISDRTSAVLVLARLPGLVLGFALITGQDPATVAVMTGIALVAAALLYPWVVGRLRRAARRR
jgi:hypothetical protein